MTDQAEQNGYCVTRVPSLRERFWRSLGYHYNLVDLPETPEVDKMPGWALTHINLTMPWHERLRLLLTGRMKIDVRQKFSADVAEVVSAASTYIFYPGERT